MTDRFAAHAERLAHSYALLQGARERARKDLKYDSVETRQKMTEACKAKTGLTPRDEQLDIAECLLLGLDATLIAGTGWGKTLAFALPSFVEERKVTIIVSPLNVLEADQAARFSSWDLPAIGLNGTTSTDAVLEKIKAGAYRFVIVGPELCVDADSPFRPLLSNPAFNKKVGALIVDEAHCITQWGTGFRPKYAELDKLRAFMRIHVSVLLASATMGPVALAQARRTMHIHSDNSFHLNLGNDRPNISWEVQRMSAGKSDLEALRLLVPPDGTVLSHLPRTIVFFDDILLSLRALRWFREQLPEALRGRVKTYHARRRQLGKDITFEEFRTGRVDILFATESAGMGCDIPDIELVVQFMAPESLSIWFQRAGRAGRSPDIQARAVLLIQPSAFHEKGKGSRKPGDPIEYVKQLEPGLRMWVEPPPGSCRRDVADEYFDNPRRCQAPTGDCCDSCSKQKEAERLTSINVDIPIAKPSPSVEQGVAAAVPREPSTPQPIWRSAVPTTRSDDHLAEATRLLQDWRRRTWLAEYNQQPYGPSGILPDATLKALALKTAYLSIADLTGLAWAHGQKHGDDVLAILHTLDRKHALAVLADEAAKRVAAEMKREAERHEREVKAQQRREEKALDKFVQDQKKQALKEAQRAEKARQKAEETKRKAAEREAVKEARRVQKARLKAEEKARKQAEKAAKQAESANKSARTRKRKSEAMEKENNTEAPNSDMHTAKRLREEDAHASSSSLSLAATTTISAMVPHSRPKPRPVRRPALPVEHTAYASYAPEAALQAQVPLDVPATTASALPIHLPSTPYRTLVPTWSYPTPVTPHFPSLSRLLNPATPTPLYREGSMQPAAE